MTYLVKIDKRIIESKRLEIYDAMIQQSANITNGTIKAISAEDLKLLFSLYDSHFFNHWFRDTFKGEFKFSLSRRMTRSAGLTLCPKHIGKLRAEEVVIEIRIGADFFFDYHRVEGSKMVCGVKTTDSLQALQLVFEHELCHAIEFILYHASSCKKERFRRISNEIFGHMDTYHKLPGSRQIAGEEFGLKIGAEVCFVHEGKKKKGIIYAINKRATVMVKDPKGMFTDKKGNRFSKYYIPLHLLK